MMVSNIKYFSNKRGPTLLCRDAKIINYDFNVLFLFRVFSGLAIRWMEFLMRSNVKSGMTIPFLLIPQTNGK